jgi:protein-tyrosine-phosphatase
MKKKVLFACEYHSGRSVMAEAFLNRLCSEEFHAASAGFTPLPLPRVVIEVMREVGHDLSEFQPVRAADLVGQHFDYVITVSDLVNAALCPRFAGAPQRLHWMFPNPDTDEGDYTQKLARAREVRAAVQLKIAGWCAANCGQSLSPVNILRAAGQTRDPAKPWPAVSLHGRRFAGERMAGS